MLAGAGHPAHHLNQFANELQIFIVTPPAGSCPVTSTLRKSLTIKSAPAWRSCIVECVVANPITLQLEALPLTTPKQISKLAFLLSVNTAVHV